jgi:mono/diheme cytochrome c family protein
MLAATLLFLTACGSARRSEPITDPLPIDSPSIANGRKVFVKQCDQCHPRGEAGLGPALNNKPIPGFMIRFQVRNGLGAMPAFSKKEISDDELKDLLQYIRAVKQNG